MPERAVVLRSEGLNRLDDHLFTTIIPSGAKRNEVLELIEKKMIKLSPDHRGKCSGPGSGIAGDRREFY